MMVVNEAVPAFLYEDNDNEFLDMELELMSSSINALDTPTAPES